MKETFLPDLKKTHQGLYWSFVYDCIFLHNVGPNPVNFIVLHINLYLFSAKDRKFQKILPMVFMF